MKQTSLEFQLLLTCAGAGPIQKRIPEIETLLSGGIEWRFFLREAIDHDLTYQTIYRLIRVAPHLVPKLIRDAVLSAVEATRVSNNLVLDTIVRLTEYLATNNIDAIPIDDPHLSTVIYEDVAVRPCNRIRLLIRGADVRTARALLSSLGYQEGKKLSEPQIELIHRITGSTTLIKPGHVPIELCTEIVPRRFALNIDYAGIWKGAKTTNFKGHGMSSLAPEDLLLSLAVACGVNLWRNIHQTCDFAAFMFTHSDLNWRYALEHAKLQECSRILLLSVALACAYFGAEMPGEVQRLLDVSGPSEKVLQYYATNWYVEASFGRARDRQAFPGRLSPHDTILQRIKFAARSLFLPDPDEIASLRFPNFLSRALLPCAVVYRVISWAPRRIYRRVKFYRMNVLIVCGMWGGGTSAVAGMLEALGAKGLGQHRGTADERTPTDYESIPFDARTQRYVSQRTLARRAVDADWALNGLRDFRRNIELQKYGPYDPLGSPPLYFKIQLSTLLLSEICNVFDAKLIYVTRPLEDIERTRIRRNWSQESSRATAEVIYDAMERFAQRRSNPILRISYPHLLASPAEFALELARFAGLHLDPLALQRAVKFIASHPNYREAIGHRD